MGEEATQKLAGLVEKIEPIVENVTLQLELPTLEDSVSDLDRLRRALKKSGYDISRMSTNIKSDAATDKKRFGMRTLK